MCLRLCYLSDKDKISNVLHEFGHALGLDHEHQRSDFWDVLEEKDENGVDRFIIGEENMRAGIGGCEKAIDAVFRIKNKTDHTHDKTYYDKREETEYDSDSIMHYW